MNPKVATRGLLVTFSGLDGAGKSTQIGYLESILSAHGYSIRRLTFWDDVVMLARYREGFVHKVYKSERGIGTPGKPVERRDKNVRKWYLKFVRPLLYLADAVHLAWTIHRERRSADVLIFDRYIYDEWANLPLNKQLTRWYIHLLEMIVPLPHLALLLDADPAAARARKPEYPVDFMHECRQSYKTLAALLGTMTIIPPLPLAEAKDRIENLFWIMTGDPTRHRKTESQKMDQKPAA